MDTLQWVRDRIESPLFGDVSPAHPLLILAFLILVDFAWIRVLHYME